MKIRRYNIVCKKKGGIYISSFQIIIFKSNRSCSLQVEWL